MPGTVTGSAVAIHSLDFALFLRQGGLYTEEMNSPLGARRNEMEANPIGISTPPKSESFHRRLVKASIANLMTQDDPPFWRRKSLREMTDSEWESLCDGCGRCCLNKLEEEGTDRTFYTNVGCPLQGLQEPRSPGG
jgi:hypothetical protein